MKISVITPNRNGEAHLAKTLASVLRQREAGVDLEYIVVDRGKHRRFARGDRRRRYRGGIDRLICRRPTSGPGGGDQQGAARRAGEGPRLAERRRPLRARRPGARGAGAGSQSVAGAGLWRLPHRGRAGTGNPPRHHALQGAVLPLFLAFRHPHDQLHLATGHVLPPRGDRAGRPPARGLARRVGLRAGTAAVGPGRVKSLIENNREGILVGSGCGNGEIFKLLLRKQYDNYMKRLIFMIILKCSHLAII